MNVAGTGTAPDPRVASPWPYVLPFGVLMVLLGLNGHLPLPAAWAYPARTLAVLATLLAVSRPVLDFRVRSAAGSVILGVVVFVVWIAPDLLVPGWRNHWLFSNFLLGRADGAASAPHSIDPVFVFFRAAGSAMLVPVVEELFWRAFLMRWLSSHQFWTVPFGKYVPTAFWLTVVLFGLEHGPHWEVGLVAGAAYGWWMVKTRSLGDCILAHAVTNAALAAYVLLAGKWEYWL
ncbi:MAG TPA: CAAX prenyl protease-related protein [Bryobacteraceae bacterium]|nr:CAAX prenyl protease-related protein [Bryobacteraceae bacterium]